METMVDVSIEGGKRTAFGREVEYIIQYCRNINSSNVKSAEGKDSDAGR